MRHDAEQALDDHQLSPVVNLMLFAADQHLEAAFVPWTAPSACYELDRPRFGQLFDPIAPVFPAVLPPLKRRSLNVSGPPIWWWS